jgi:hypothetical protein
MEMPAEEREAMAVCARDCFHRRYDMRENAKTVVRVFEKNGGQWSVVSGQW